MFKTFIPSIQNNKIISKKGMGLTGNVIKDVDDLNCNLFYNWSVSKELLDDTRYVPMLWEGSVNTNIPKNFNRNILFLNEPNNAGQANKTALESFYLYLKAEDYYPNAKLVVGGICSLPEIFGWTHWMEEFLEILYKNNEPIPHYWHFHGYIESFPTDERWNTTVESVITLWKQQLFLIGDSVAWITEYGDTNGNLDNFKKLTQFLLNEKKIEKIFPFGARLDITKWWYPSNWQKPCTFAMIDNNGNLTEFGKYYKNV